MITIEKLNETHLRVRCSDAGVAAEMSEYFKYRVEGYQFMPKYKARMWDGFFKLYNMHTKCIYVGLLPVVEKFAKDRDYPIEYKSEFLEKEFSVHEAEQFFESLGTSFNKEDFQTNLQITTFAKAIRKKRSLIISPTGSGKSFIIYLLTRYYNKKTMIIVPNIALVHQMTQDFVDYGFDKDRIHKVYADKDKNTDHDVVIGTWQSLSKMPQERLDQFKVVVGDEVHLFSAKILTGLMEKLVSCEHRFGLTGSLDKSECNKLVLLGLFGNIIQETTTAELIEKKVLAPLSIKCIILKYPEAVRKSVRGAEYESEIEHIISKDSRNNFIKNLALSLKGNTLILFTRIEKHGDILDRKIAPLVGDRKYFYIHGGVGGEDRDAIRPIVEQENSAIILASYGTLSTGINIKNISNIIFASPYKSQVKVLQSIGRGLRALGDKKLTLFDIADDISWKKTKNHTLRHFADRVEIYDAQQFPYELHLVGIS